MAKATLEDVDISLQLLILSIGPEPSALKKSAETALESVRANNLDSGFRAAIADIKKAKGVSPLTFGACRLVLKILHDAQVPGYGADLEN